MFESVSEASRGERSVDESEHRLKLFAERVTKRGLGDGRKLKLKQSRAALETFLELNVFILNIKKVCSISCALFGNLTPAICLSSSLRMRRRHAKFSRNTRSALPCQPFNLNIKLYFPAAIWHPFQEFWFKPSERRCSPLYRILMTMPV